MYCYSLVVEHKPSPQNSLVTLSPPTTPRHAKSHSTARLCRVLQESLYGYHHNQFAAAAAAAGGHHSSALLDSVATTPDHHNNEPESFGGFPASANNAKPTDDFSSVLVPQRPTTAMPAVGGDLDADLAMALRISEQEQAERLAELDREQQMLDMALRLSLQEH